MSDQATGESGEEQIDEAGRNATQQRVDAEGAEPRPTDAPWGGEESEEAAGTA